MNSIRSQLRQREEEERECRELNEIVRCFRPPILLIVIIYILIAVRVARLLTVLFCTNIALPVRQRCTLLSTHRYHNTGAKQSNTTLCRFQTRSAFFRVTAAAFDTGVGEQTGIGHLSPTLVSSSRGPHKTLYCTAVWRQPGRDTFQHDRNVGDIPKVDLEVIVAHEVDELDSEQLFCMASVGRNLQVVALNRYSVANAIECVSRTCTLRRGAVASPLTTQLYAAFERPSCSFEFNSGHVDASIRTNACEIGPLFRREGNTCWLESSTGGASCRYGPPCPFALVRTDARSSLRRSRPSLMASNVTVNAFLESSPAHVQQCDPLRLFCQQSSLSAITQDVALSKL